MPKKLLAAALCIVFLFGMAGILSAQEPEEDGGFIIEEPLEPGFKGEPLVPSFKEEPLEPGFKTELKNEEPQPQFITADVLTTRDVEPAINFYIRSDIDRKFSGLITNLKLEKIYGILQEDKAATVYFDYSYTSVRNRDNVLFEKGKMTFMKFNSGKWFNAELSIYLMDLYPFKVLEEQRERGE